MLSTILGMIAITAIVILIVREAQKPNPGRLEYVENTDKHFNSDAGYYKTVLNNQTYLFTEEQIEVARDRAERYPEL